jgi:hypothetical protein
MAVENISLEAAVDYIKSPRRGKAFLPYERQYPDQEPAAKKSKPAANAQPLNTPESSIPGIKSIHTIRFIF